MSERFNLQHFGHLILNAVFPPRCVSCRRFGEWVCTDCWGKIELMKTPICYRCHKLSDNFKVCEDCQRYSSCDRVIICGYFRGSLKQFIYGLKYRRVKPIALMLGQLLCETARNYLMGQAVVIVPVPLHRGRLGQRGFNQSLMLSNILSHQLQQPLLSVLVRKKSTKPQFGLDRKERALNVDTAFDIQLSYKPYIQNRIILLVDDVVTTGATLNECAKILKQHGACEVWGLVLAKP